MIGIFDSGIGGLTVAKEVMNLLPEIPILYLGDSARAPYGNKSQQTIDRYAGEDIGWLARGGAKIFVVACNSMSVSVDKLRGKINKPVFDVIAPAVEQALRSNDNGRIGVIGTRATVASGVYEKLIHDKDKTIDVFAEACPLLVPLVEEGWIDKPETENIVENYLAPLKDKKIGVLILGCTHYPLLENIIRRQMGESVKLINSAAAAAQKVKEYLAQQKELMIELSTNYDNEFYLTDLAPSYDTIASVWLERKVKFCLADLNSD